MCVQNNRECYKMLQNIMQTYVYEYIKYLYVYAFVLSPNS